MKRFVCLSLACVVQNANCGSPVRGSFEGASQQPRKQSSHVLLERVCLQNALATLWRSGAMHV